MTFSFHLKFQVYDPNVVHEILFVIKFMKCSPGNLNGGINYLFSFDFSLNATLVRKHLLFQYVLWYLLRLTLWARE